jgi:ribosome-binding factor A
MMTETDARARRLAERIQVIVAETIERRIKDPRMGFMTVTDVRVTRDLREATVFYTVLGDATEQSDTAEALESAKGMLRTEVGRQTGIRHTPSLAFIADAIPETARHLDDLLRAARADDERVHEQAVAATYAGESDPYRHDEDLDGGDLEEVGLDDAGLEEAGGASA